VDKMDYDAILPQRKVDLAMLIAYIQEKRNNKKEILLNFICTHNSRRSQFSQIWAQVAADYYKVEASCYSGGVEETAFNERAVASLERFGFTITKTGDENPRYFVMWNEASEPLGMYSKMYDDSLNPSSGF